jgi:4-hydroxyphenylacetate 3-monooxygenase
VAKREVTDAVSRPLVLRDAARGASVTLHRPQVLIAGYTGRDIAAVEAHIAELAAQGVPPPVQVPSFFTAPPASIVLAPGAIETSSVRTSGEAEPVLIRAADGELFVGVGSDHTDREIERTSIHASKLACPKVLGADVWSLASVIDHWDDLELSSSVDATERRYQSCSVAQLRRPDEVLELAEPWIEEPESELVLFLGTVPLLEGEFVFSDFFRAWLTDAGAGRELACEYHINNQEPT